MPARSSQSPLEVARGNIGGLARASQSPLEVARGNIGGVLRASQVVLEVLQPFVPADTAGTGVVPLVFTATASARRNSAAAALSAVTFAAAAAETRLPGTKKAASATVVFTATASETADTSRRKAASDRILFHARAVSSGLNKVNASTLILFHARAANKSPDVVFADNYLGRFQQGGLAPLQVVVKNDRGVPTDPSVSPPSATVYRLDDRTKVDVLEVPRLHHGRVSMLYAGPLRLGRVYPRGKYAVLYRSRVGGSTVYETVQFEVDGGGDFMGPVTAAYVLERPQQTVVLVGLGSGALLAARGPKAK